MEFLEQEHISPALLDGVRAYRAQYPAEPALQGAATEPAAAVRRLADYLQQGDLAGFARAAARAALRNLRASRTRST